MEPKEHCREADAKRTALSISHSGGPLTGEQGPPPTAAPEALKKIMEDEEDPEDEIL